MDNKMMEVIKSMNKLDKKVLDTKFTKGKVITFKKPIDFGEFSENTFRYLGGNKFRSINYGGVYNIPSWLVTSLM